MIYVVNPWTGAWAEIAPEEVTQDKLDGMVLDEEVVEQIHLEGDAQTPVEFFRRYVEIVGPEAGGIAWFS